MRICGVCGCDSESETGHFSNAAGYCRTMRTGGKQCICIRHEDVGARVLEEDSDS